MDERIGNHQPFYDVRFYHSKSDVGHKAVDREACYGAYIAGSCLSDHEISARVCHHADFRIFCHVIIRQIYKCITRREVSFRYKCYAANSIERII